MQKIETFGGMLRRLREKKEMPIRKLASLLDLDQSTLSKIERDERRANSEMIDKIAEIFEIDRKELMINFLSDKIYYTLAEEQDSQEVLKVAEMKILYLKKSQI
ncbi:MAG TPA: helix-turn-helix transcriptional regulator [Candidatus Kapabacteria bacterium]|nr:helix-turn-helix transcriptional regulator [Candidatus Kapabacteria bacterium]